MVPRIPVRFATLLSCRSVVLSVCRHSMVLRQPVRTANHQWPSHGAGSRPRERWLPGTAPSLPGRRPDPVACSVSTFRKIVTAACRSIVGVNSARFSRGATADVGEASPSQLPLPFCLQVLPANPPVAVIGSTVTPSVRCGGRTPAVAAVRPFVPAPPRLF